MCVQAWVLCPVWCVPQVQMICWGSWRDRNKDSFFIVRCSCWDGPWEWPMRQDTPNKFRIKISTVLYWSWWTARQTGLYCRNHQLLNHWIAGCSLLSIRLMIPRLCPFRGACYLRGQELPQALYSAACRDSGSAHPFLYVSYEEQDSL